MSQMEFLTFSRLACFSGCGAMLREPISGRWATTRHPPSCWSQTPHDRTAGWRDDPWWQHTFTVSSAQNQCLSHRINITLVTKNLPQEHHQSVEQNTRAITTCTRVMILYHAITISQMNWKISIRIATSSSNLSERRMQSQPRDAESLLASRLLLSRRAR